MDYIDGVTLQDILKENGAQSQENVVNWALQLCDVLDYLHTRKPPIIYRDIKPSNIMLKSDGSLVLIDFGTAKEFDVIYTYISEKMTAANISKNPDDMELVLVELRELRDIWKQVMRTAKDPRI